MNCSETNKNSSTRIGSIFEKFIMSMSTLCQQLNDDSNGRGSDDLNTDEFWNNFVGATKLLSHDATKIGLLFNGEQEQPSDSECQSLIDGMESRCLALLATYYTFPVSKGKIVRKDLRIFVQTVLQAVTTMCINAKNKSPELLKTVSNVWNECEAAQKLPRENKSAVMLLIQQQQSIVQDALEELQEAFQQDGEIVLEEAEDASTLNGLEEYLFPQWTDDDRQLLPPCLGLVKSVKACLKQTHKAISRHENLDHTASISQLDDVAEICYFSSALVDEFITSLYSMELSSIREQASKVVENCKELLSTDSDSYFCTEEDKKSWIEFLLTAVDHNRRKLDHLIQERLTED